MWRYWQTRQVQVAPLNLGCFFLYCLGKRRFFISIPTSPTLASDTGLAPENTPYRCQCHPLTPSHSLCSRFVSRVEAIRRGESGRQDTVASVE